MELKTLALSALLTLPLAGLTRADEAALSPTAKTTATASSKAVKVAKPKKPKKAKPLAAVKKEHWICPMHDGGESDHAGKCPKCGMNLVKVDQ